MERSSNTHPDPSKLTQTDHVNKKLLVAFKNAMDGMNIPANEAISTEDNDESAQQSEEAIDR